MSGRVDGGPAESEAVVSGPKRTEPSRHLFQGHLYVPAAHTDIRVRFEQVREDMARALLARHAPKVATLRRKP